MSTAQYARGFRQFSRNRLFEGVGPEVFKEVAPQLRVIQLRKDQVIFREGDRGDSLYLVGRGSVRICKRNGDGEPQTVGLIEKGNFFGATALLAKEPRSTMAVAAESSVLGTVKEQTFQHILELAPSRLHLNFLRALNERMRRVNAYFVKQTLREERLRVVEAIAESILRELKNPACVARCYAGLMTGEITDPRLNDVGAMLDRAVGRLLGRTQDMLDFSRDRIVAEKQEIGVKRLLEGVRERSSSILSGRNVVLVEHIRYEATLPIDFPRMLRVFDSVVQNACDAMPDGGTLTITADLVHEDVALRISDTGAGIPPELLTKLFRPFGVRSQSNSGGFSLAVAKAVVEAHGGRVSIDSVYGKGTTVDIRLPLADEPLVA